MATGKPKNNLQMRIFKYIGAKYWNNTDPVRRDTSSLVACIKEILLQGVF